MIIHFIIVKPLPSVSVTTATNTDKNCNKLSINKTTTMLSSKSLSKNLKAALNVCSILTVDELLDLALAIGGEKWDIQCQDEWVAAIATVLERKCPIRSSLN